MPEIPHTGPLMNKEPCLIMLYLWLMSNSSIFFISTRHKQTTGPISLIFDLHVNDCAQGPLLVAVIQNCWKTCFIDCYIPPMTTDSSLLLTGWYRLQVFFKTRNLTICCRPHFGLHHGSKTDINQKVWSYFELQHLQINSIPIMLWST